MRLLASSVRRDWNLPHSRASPASVTLGVARQAHASGLSGRLRTTVLVGSAMPWCRPHISSSTCAKHSHTHPCPPSFPLGSPLAGHDDRHDAPARIKTVLIGPTAAARFPTMKRFFSFYVLCLLGPLLEREPATSGRGVKAATTMTTAYAPARPASLVLPTYQRPHVIAHRGGEYGGREGRGKGLSCGAGRWLGGGGARDPASRLAQ